MLSAPAKWRSSTQALTAQTIFRLARGFAWRDRHDNSCLPHAHRSFPRSPRAKGRDGSEDRWLRGISFSAPNNWQCGLCRQRFRLRAGCDPARWRCDLEKKFLRAHIEDLVERGLVGTEGAGPLGALYRPARANCDGSFAIISYRQPLPVPPRNWQYCAGWRRNRKARSAQPNGCRFASDRRAALAST
jgi:hypothetical protein